MFREGVSPLQIPEKKLPPTKEKIMPIPKNSRVERAKKALKNAAGGARKALGILGRLSLGNSGRTLPSEQQTAPLTIQPEIRTPRQTVESANITEPVAIQPEISNHDEAAESIKHIDKFAREIIATKDNARDQERPLTPGEREREHAIRDAERRQVRVILEVIKKDPASPLAQYFQEIIRRREPQGITEADLNAINEEVPSNDWNTLNKIATKLFLGNLTKVPEIAQLAEEEKIEKPLAITSAALEKGSERFPSEPTVTTLNTLLEGLNLKLRDADVRSRQLYPALLPQDAAYQYAHLATKEYAYKIYKIATENPQSPFARQVNEFRGIAGLPHPNKPGERLPSVLDKVTQAIQEEQKSLDNLRMKYNPQKPYNQGVGNYEKPEGFDPEKVYSKDKMDQFSKSNLGLYMDLVNLGLARTKLSNSLDSMVTGLRNAKAVEPVSLSYAANTEPSPLNRQPNTLPVKKPLRPFTIPPRPTESGGKPTIGQTTSEESQAA